ncbi:MAG: DUF4011 domain-containing protein [Candidatus Portiera sp.]|nr:DUF4011 domain-containing protein [Portiera sp.]
MTIKDSIERKREDLLELSARNPLVDTKLSYKSLSFINLVDEQPQQVYERISQEKKMEFKSLPPLPSTQDESTQDKSNQGKKTDEQMAQEWATNNKINCSYELPPAEVDVEDNRHSDTLLQTLFFSDNLDKKLRKLKSKSDEWANETGINVLKLAFGFLKWKDPSNDKYRIAPLLLLPVIIEKEKNKRATKFKVSGTGEKIAVNLVFNLKLQNDFNQESLPEIEDFLIEEEDGDSGYYDLEKYFNALEKYLVGMKDILDVSFSRQIVFGVFPSHSMAMYHDLDPSKQDIASRKIINTIFGENAGGNNVPSPYEDDFSNLEHHSPEFFAPVKKVDPSQFAVIQESMKGSNLAIEGPPGTGKSDTIVNIIAATLGQGKKVLFVAEKMAALEVVKNRLDSVGLGEFALPLQAKRASREEVIKSIYQRMEMSQSKDQDTHTELIKDFEQVKQDLDLYCQTLRSEYKNTSMKVHEILTKNIALHDIAETNPEIFRAYNNSENDINIFSKTEIKTQRDQCNDLKELEDSVIAAQVFWQGQRQSKRNPNKFIIDEISDLTQDLSNVYSDLSKLYEDLTKYGFSDKYIHQEKNNLRRFIQILLNKKLKLNKDFIKEIAAEDSLSLVNKFISDCEAIKKFKEICEKYFDDIEHLVKNKGCADVKVKDMIVAREIVFKAGKDVLSLRPSKIEEEIINSLDSLINKIEIIIKIHKKHSDRIKFNQDIKFNNSLDNALVSLQNRNFFSFLSPTYIRARSICKKISVEGKFEYPQSTKDLAIFIDWFKKYGVYDNEMQEILSTSMMPNLDSLDKLMKLRDFYKSIDLDLKGIINNDLRKLLISEDVSLLLSLPPLEDVGGVGDFNDRSKLADLISNIKIALDKAENTIKQDIKIKDIFKDYFKGIETDYEIFNKEIKIANIICRRQNNSQDKSPIYNILFTAVAHNRLEEIGNKVKSIFSNEESIHDITSELDNKKIKTDNLLQGNNFSEIADYLHKASIDKKGLELNLKFLNKQIELEKNPLAWLIHLIKENRGNYQDLPEIIEAILYQVILRDVYTDGNIQKILSLYSGERIHKLQNKLGHLDDEIINQNTLLLRQKLIRQVRYIAGNNQGKVKDYTEMGLIEHEINKKKRFVSVRTLVNNAGKSLQELKPCWMMSPLAVANYLPPEDNFFDLCIIDEASQMIPAHALGALARCKQCIIVGDTNQLPPTSFFMRSSNIDDDEADRIDDESILSVANKAFRPKRQLLWHYRSKHHGLINFSNNTMYGGKLRVSPSPVETEEEAGVSLTKVEGVYASSVNEIEAEEVVKEIINFMKSTPDRSLGVVALNIKQKELIENIFDQTRSENRDHKVESYLEKWEEADRGLECFFIKNLENVQGDERDVIFISTVYGPDEGGKVRQNFGPINGDAGTRRLNVLFSRSKYRIVTFTSLKPSDITNHKNLGANMLKQWLEYSETKKLPETIKDAGGEPDSYFEEWIIDEINNMGYQAVPQVGSSGYSIDIGIKHPDCGDDYILGVECDGAKYHSQKYARERDRGRQEILESNGWNIYRIWSTDWFNNTPEELTRLKNKLDSVKSSHKNFVTRVTVS